MRMDSPLFRLLADPISLLSGMIMRPPRAKYSTCDLGHPRFTITGCPGEFERRDFQVRGGRGMLLECSHFVPSQAPPARKLPCVVYLHGSCSSRLEALDTLRELLPRGLTVCCVDFSGSGLSEGEYISLGHWEERDLAALVRHLRDSGSVSSIGLWGRSMGAATAVLRASQDPSIAACVLDSAFGCLPTVARELVQRTRWKIPESLVSMALDRVRKEVQAKVDFDIEELRPVAFAPRSRVPALFAVAKEDDFVLPHHTYDIHQAWGCADKKLVTVGGHHDSLRPKKFMQFAADFLQQRLLLAAKDGVGSPAYSTRTPTPARSKRTSQEPAARKASHCFGGC